MPDTPPRMDREKLVADWHECYLVSHRDNMKLAARNMELRKALEKIKVTRKACMKAQNLIIRTGLVVIDEIVKKALNGGNKD